MKTEEELIQFEKQWNKALENNDVDEISKFMSPDWIIVGSDGITTKSAFLESVRTGILRHNRMDSDKTTAKIYGNTGIIISRGTSAGTYNGQALDQCQKLWSKV